MQKKFMVLLAILVFPWLMVPIGSSQLSHNFQIELYTGIPNTNPSDFTILSASGPAHQDCLCLALYDPVCGMNEKTYSNTCEANCAGISIKSSGPC